MLYAVCTSCPFLRAYSREGGDVEPLPACPACGSELVIRRRAGRFPPTYVSRVSRDVLGTPELRPDDPRRR